MSDKTHYNEMNVLSMHALIGAYQPQGYEWVDELNQVLAGNIEYFCNYVDEHFEGVSYSRPQGTYMVFLDCTEWCREHGRDIQWLLDEGARVGVGYQGGPSVPRALPHRVNLAAAAFWSVQGSVRTRLDPATFLSTVRRALHAGHSAKSAGRPHMVKRL